jgi:hypothetical protein
MAIHSTTRENPARPVREWRRRRLLALGLSEAAAQRLADDRRVDLHALLGLVDRGCPPGLAVRILAPLDDVRERR